MKILGTFAIILLLQSCANENEHFELFGTWTPITNEQGLETNYSGEIQFTKDGHYNAITKFNDTLLYKVSGEYTVDDSLKTLKIKFIEIMKSDEQLNVPDSTHTVQVIKLTNKELILESLNGTSAYYRHE